MQVVQRREAVAKPGDVVEGRYRIIQPLGEGGMGTVFLAEHTMINRRVAMKILHPELATDAIVVERFMNEARAAGTLGHPNIVESTDMGFTNHHIPFIAFEYLEGTLLTDEIYRTGGMPVRRAVRIATQIASALHAAHNAGIVHRDLKSDNVFLTDEGNALDHVKVLDFGISRFLMQDDQQKSMIMGTPEFMAPEQITAPESVDKRADIYALGVILYEALTARRPFTSDEPRQVLHRIVHDLPPPLTGHNVPHGLAELILTKMLAKNPDDRISSMVDVETALSEFDARPDGTPVSKRRRRQPFTGSELADRAAPQGSPAQAPVQAQPSSKNRPYMLYAVTGISIAIGAIGVGVGVHSRSHPASLIPPPPTVNVVEPSPPATAKLYVEANAPNAHVLVRHRVTATPISLEIAPADVEELVEIGAPKRKTVRYWLTLNRSIELNAHLPKGSGVIEATAEETQAALDRGPQRASTAAANTLPKMEALPRPRR